MLLDYTTYNNVSGANDFFDKLRLWAVSKGWYQEEWRTGYLWDSNNHWVSDSRGRFLILSKSGYGTQNLIVSLATSIESTYNCFGITGCMRSQVSYNDTSESKHPVGQNSICGGVHNQSSGYYSNKESQTGGFDLGESFTIPKVWFFAGPHWIAAFAKMNDEFCQWLHFGSCEMFEDSPTLGQCFGMYSRIYNYTGQGYQYPWEWTNYQYGLSTGYYMSPGSVSYVGLYATNRWCGFDMYYDGHGFYNTSHTLGAQGRSNCHQSFAYMISTYPPLLDVSVALKANHYSAKRPMIKPTFSYERASDSIYVPIAKAPFYIMNTAGLQIGQQLDFDGSSYLAFPTPTIYNTHGIAICINDGTLTTTTV